MRYRTAPIQALRYSYSRRIVSDQRRYADGRVTDRPVAVECPKEVCIMKRIIFKTFGGLALLAVAPLGAPAYADLRIGVGIYAPAPYYVEPPPVYYQPPPRYYSPPPPVYYGPSDNYEGRDWDHHDHWREGHDRGRHRGWHHHDEND